MRLASENNKNATLPSKEGEREGTKIERNARGKKELLFTVLGDHEEQVNVPYDKEQYYLKIKVVLIFKLILIFVIPSKIQM